MISCLDSDYRQRGIVLGCDYEATGRRCAFHDSVGESTGIAQAVGTWHFHRFDKFA